MKKTKLITLFLTLCLSLCSCNSNDTNSGAQDTTDVSESEIETIETTETTDVAEENSVWSINEYVDEFDRPTGQRFIMGTGTGTFSNSATNNSDLLAAIIIDMDKYEGTKYPSVSIALWEYANHMVKNTYNEKRFYGVKILKENETKVSFLGLYPRNSTKMLIGNAYRKIYNSGSNNLELEVSNWLGEDLYFIEYVDGTPIVELLKNNSTLKIYIEDAERPATNYLFSIDTTGFSELFDETFNFDI